MFEIRDKARATLARIKPPPVWIAETQPSPDALQLATFVIAQYIGLAELPTDLEADVRRYLGVEAHRAAA